MLISRLSNSRTFFLLVLILVWGVPFHAKSQTTTSNDSWYIEGNMLTLSSANRYLGTVIVSNPTRTPVYVTSSVESLTLGVSGRQRSAEGIEAIRVYPERFVLRPGETFSVRIAAQADKVSRDSQSFYVRLTDASNVDDAEAGSGLTSAFMIGYDVMVAVDNTGGASLDGRRLVWRQLSSGAQVLENRTGRHVYLESVSACPDVVNRLDQCTVIKNAPKQSLLPDETVAMPGTDAEKLGIQLRRTLNAKDFPQTFYLTKTAE